jgi:hypothetical protein
VNGKGLAAVVPLYQIKDDGQVFLRIGRRDPPRVLSVAAKEAEDVRHRKALGFFEHLLQPGCR